MTRSSSFLRTLIAAVLLALGVTVIVIVPESETEARPSGPRAAVTAADGGFREPARAGAVVFEVSGLGPGDSASGTVRVRNGGNASGLFLLTRAGLSDSPGTNGGRLSERLELAVLDISEPSGPAVVYTGGVGPLSTRPLGVMRPGETRTYSMRATVLTGQTPTVPLGGGDPYEGSSTRISLRWQAIHGLPPTDLTSLLRRRDRTPPKRPGPELTLIAAPRQSVIGTGRLDTVVRCSEPCRVNATGRLPLGPPRAVPIATRAEGLRTETRLRLVFTAGVQRELRDALAAGRSVAIAVRVRASDRAGNESVLRDTVNLRPSR